MNEKIPKKKLRLHKKTPKFLSLDLKRSLFPNIKASLSDAVGRRSFTTRSKWKRVKALLPRTFMYSGKRAASTSSRTELSVHRFSCFIRLPWAICKFRGSSMQWLPTPPTTEPVGSQVLSHWSATVQTNAGLSVTKDALPGPAHRFSSPRQFWAARPGSRSAASLHLFGPVPGRTTTLFDLRHQIFTCCHGVPDNSGEQYRVSQPDLGLRLNFLENLSQPGAGSASPGSRVRRTQRGGARASGAVEPKWVGPAQVWWGGPRS